MDVMQYHQLGSLAKMYNVSGIRQEQDLYVRLIDSSTKQVRLFSFDQNGRVFSANTPIISPLRFQADVYASSQIWFKKNVELINLLRLGS